jgi:site-specific DNA recombinase
MLVALYVRVSTTRQAENDLSIPDQLRQLQEWCAHHGHSIVQEYVEPGASATDDRRPVFQQMIADSALAPAPFQAILVHSLSRFFRDSVAFGSYERKLKKRGIRIISISQQTADDAAGDLVRQVISSFDEYQSKETAKHVSRSMKENARQGYSNGHKPYGYMNVETGESATRGRKKKRLAIDEAEAAIVRKIYALYLHGLHGHTLGCKEIAKHLTERNIPMRSGAWTIQKVHKILSDSLYMGEYYYNVHDTRTGQKRPPHEWVRVAIPAIADAELFQRVREKREMRAPDKIPARQLDSKTLLTGLMRCGHCGAGMTLATGKSGQYRYYKCTRRISQGNHACESKNFPMEKTDAIILDSVANVAFSPERLKAMVAGIKSRTKQGAASYQGQITVIDQQLKVNEKARNNFYAAIERGIVELDEYAQKRGQQLKAERDALLLERARLVREQNLPLSRLSEVDVLRFGDAVRSRFMVPSSPFAKSYLQLLVKEITIHGQEATLKGEDVAILNAMGKINAGQVPSSVVEWRTQRDSNS